MGAGGTGALFTYQESADSKLNGGTFLLDLVDNTSLGNGFDSAKFQIVANGKLFDSKSFTDLASADAFFSNNLLTISLAADLYDVKVLFNETMSSGEGFSFDYAAVSTTPLPPSWTMMLIGLAGLGFFAYRQSEKSQG
jgi:hypothetical protein